MALSSHSSGSTTETRKPRPFKAKSKPELFRSMWSRSPPKELLMKQASHGGLRGTGEDARRSIGRLGVWGGIRRLLFYRLRVEFLDGFASG